jgi:hypothetical protein
MAAKHGTRRRYIAGCRCEDCAEAERVYRRAYRQRKAAEGAASAGVSAPVVTLRTSPDTPQAGAVEAAVELEITGLAQAEARPGLAQAALALARIMDNPKAISQQPAASKSLAEILDKLRKGADARKSRLASVRSMTVVKSSTG